jgi:hypothetical protein
LPDLTVLALAHLRAGRADLAVRWATQAQTAKSGPASAGFEATNWLVLALAQHKLGKEPEARTWLARASHWIKAKDDKLDRYEQLERLILRLEVEKRLRQQKRQ